MSPETAHEVVKKASCLIPKSWLYRQSNVSSSILNTKLASVNLKNPIGLAAGFDKNGEMTSFMESLGFGYLELGSITALPCKGQKKPRVFRLPKDQSLINRMGLPNAGADKFSKQFAKNKVNIPCGINIVKTPEFAAKNKFKTGIADFLYTYEKLYDLGAYTTFNLSCPNTKEKKTFEDPVLFESLAKEIAQLRASLDDHKPILFKLSPDLDAHSLNKIVETAIKYDFDGFVLTNTTKERPNLTTIQKKIISIGPGGLSGKSVLDKANIQLKRVYDIVGINKILIGVGGITTFEDLLSKFANGAQAVQIYTGFIYGGPFIVKKLNEDLVQFCKKLGVKNISSLIGNTEIL